MSANENQVSAAPEITKRSKISMDTWAVLFALAAATLIRSGLIKSVPW